MAYYSTKSDPAAQAYPPCLKGLVAAALLVEVSANIVLQHDLIIAAPYAAASLIRKQTQRLSTVRTLKYEMLLHITIIRCHILNPASLRPIPSDGTPHNCDLVMEYFSTPMEGLYHQPTLNPDLTL